MLPIHLPCSYCSHFQVMGRRFSKNNRESKNLLTVTSFHTVFPGMVGAFQCPFLKAETFTHCTLKTVHLHKGPSVSRHVSISQFCRDSDCECEIGSMNTGLVTENLSV